MMNQIELDFNNNLDVQTRCFECLFDNECNDAAKQQNKDKNEKDCSKYKYNDLPF